MNMPKVPWAGPIEKVLQPFEGMVTVGLWLVVFTTIFVIFKGNSTGKIAWFVWVVTP